MRALKSRGGSDLMLDMLLAAAVPMIISGVAMEWRRVHPSILRFFTDWTRWEREPKFVRTIEYEESSMFGGENDDNYECRRNNLLHRAILLYMGQELDLRYSKAQVLLSAVKEKQEFDMDDDYYGGGSKKAVYGGTAEQLKAYSVSVVPPKSDWVPLGDGVLFFQQSTTESGWAGNDIGRHARGTAKKTVTFTFASHKADGDLRIQGFLNKAFLWYCKAMESTEERFRYYYTPLTAPGGRAKAPQVLDGGWGAAKPTEPTGAVQRYKRYRLGDEKSFDTLFFPEKELLLKILHNFQHKTGKYGIKGYPHKLGLLLHGPPGTGKSSLIKALALHTERHVIDVPLARIKTNQDLMDIMFDESFPVGKQGLPTPLAVDNVIFVMEDVDATSPIVRSRDIANRNTRTTTQTQGKQTGVRKPAARGQAGTAERPVALAAEAAEKEECPAAAAQTIGVSAPTDTTTTNVATPTASPSETQSGSTTANDLGSMNPWEVPALPRVGGVVDGDRRREDGAGGDEVDTKNDAAAGNGENEKGRSTDTRAESVLGTALLQLTGEAAAKKAEADAREKERSSMADRLDLAGLLNVLDGVVDSPGRIVIMTTNFPDALDAALIRPGRIDKKIHLGYMKYEAAKEMTRHFFVVDQLTEDQDRRFRSVFDEDRSSLGDGVVGSSSQEAGEGAGRNITPAVVEQLAGEFDDVDAFIGALEAF